MNNVAKMTAFQQNSTCVNHHQNVIPGSIEVQTHNQLSLGLKNLTENGLGTNKIRAFILCFLNREPSHVTTL